MLREHSGEYVGLGQKEIMALTDGSFAKYMEFKQMSEACDEKLQEIDAQIELTTDIAGSSEEVSHRNIAEAATAKEKQKHKNVRDATSRLSLQENADLNEKYGKVADVKDDLKKQIADLESQNQELEVMSGKTKDYESRGLYSKTPDNILEQKMAELLGMEVTGAIEGLDEPFHDVEKAA